jgi:hypothetical protein
LAKSSHEQSLILPAQDWEEMFKNRGVALDCTTILRSVQHDASGMKSYFTGGGVAYRGAVDKTAIQFQI